MKKSVRERDRVFYHERARGSFPSDESTGRSTRSPYPSELSRAQCTGIAEPGGSCLISTGRPPGANFHRFERRAPGLADLPVFLACVRDRAAVGLARVIVLS